MPLQRGVRVLVVGQHRHAEAVADAGHGGADAAGAHNARRGAVQVVAQQPVQREIVVAHLHIGLADAAVGGQRQRHGVLGHRLGAVARHPQYRDAQPGGGGQVHIVEAGAAHQQQADAVFRQHLQHRGGAVGVDKGADRVAALCQGGGVHVQIGGQKLDLAAVVRVGCQNVKVIVVVLAGAIEDNFHRLCPPCRGDFISYLFGVDCPLP